jgi:predicted ATPase
VCSRDSDGEILERSEQLERTEQHGDVFAVRGRIRAFGFQRYLVVDVDADVDVLQSLLLRFGDAYRSIVVLVYGADFVVQADGEVEANGGAVEVGVVLWSLYGVCRVYPPISNLYIRYLSLSLVITKFLAKKP